MTPRNLVEVHEGCWGYRTQAGVFAPAAPVSFAVAEREIILLSGDNGSGKTTILRGMLGLVERLSGRVDWSIDPGQVGYVPQESVIDRSVPATALDVVRTGLPDAWRGGHDQAQEALDLVGLAHRERALFGSLSGGQRQRVLVARALVGKPKLLVLDEPTVNVDAETAQRIGALLEELRGRGPGMIITSHVRDWITATRDVLLRPSAPAQDEQEAPRV